MLRVMCANDLNQKQWMEKMQEQYSLKQVSAFEKYLLGIKVWVKLIISGNVRLIMYNFIIYDLLFPEFKCCSQFMKDVILLQKNSNAQVFQNKHLPF